jgi:hypothetical protein
VLVEPRQILVLLEQIILEVVEEVVAQAFVQVQVVVVDTLLLKQLLYNNSLEFGTIGHNTQPKQVIIGSRQVEY